MRLLPLALVISGLFVSSQSMANDNFEESASFAMPSSVEKKDIFKIKAAAEEGDAQAQCEYGSLFFLGQSFPKDYPEAVKWLTLAADQGNAMAQSRLGLCYHHGLGVPRDSKRAFELYLKSAEGGYVHGQVNAGLCLYLGTGVDIDYQEAVKWFQKAADQGSAQAYGMLGIAYYRGTGLPMDDVEAVKWFRLGTAGNDSNAIAFLGMCYDDGRGGLEVDSKLAYTLITRAAEMHQPLALVRLGFWYITGQGVEQSTEKARQLWEQAAEQGEPSAFYNLGHLYENGAPDFEIDYDVAFRWYKEAAEVNEPKAMVRLGYFYQSGLAGEQSNEKALALWTKAADMGDIEGLYNLGTVYHLGKEATGVEENPEQAFYWWSQAMENGHRAAIHDVGNCYYLGYGVPQDLKKAEEIWLQGAEQGDPSCFYDLGAAAAERKDMGPAITWLQKAADANHINALYTLGYYYYMGEGVEQDKEKGMALIQKSAALGNKYAQSVYTQFVESGELK